MAVAQGLPQGLSRVCLSGLQIDTSCLCMQVELQAGQRIEYKYVILEEQVSLCV